MQNVNSLLNSKALNGSEEMTAALRERAMDSGWPTDIASQISVEFDGSSLYFNIPDSIAETVYELEYGTPNRRPTSVLRGLKYRLAGLMDDVIDDELLDAMVMSDGVLHG